MPYIHIPDLQFGPQVIPFFTVFAVFASVAGIAASLHRARELNVSRTLVIRSLIWIGSGIAIGAHVVSVVLYFPHWIDRDPLILLMLWQGMSSFGGILGGIVGGMLFVRSWGIPAGKLADTHVFGGLVCLTAGRLGCALAHDHPGRMTDFVLAVRGWPPSGGFVDSTREIGIYTAGLTRHDLGLYEFLFLLPLTALLYFLRHRRPFARFHLVLLFVIYAPVRFFLDFLRTMDPRYGGLTPGQWFSIIMFLGAVVLMIRGIVQKQKQSEDWVPEVKELRKHAPQGILFLCVANSARSQMAEGIARALAVPEIVIQSAGSQPTSVRPEAVRVLAEIGIDITDHTSKSVAEIDASTVDVVITLCAEEVCPAFLGKAHRLHWKLPDPAAVTGEAEARLDAYRAIRDELHQRLMILFQ